MKGTMKGIDYNRIKLQKIFFTPFYSIELLWLDALFYFFWHLPHKLHIFGHLLAIASLDSEQIFLVRDLPHSGSKSMQSPRRAKTFPSVYLLRLPLLTFKKKCPGSRIMTRMWTNMKQISSESTKHYKIYFWWFCRHRFKVEIVDPILSHFNPCLSLPSAATKDRRKISTATRSTTKK